VTETKPTVVPVELDLRGEIARLNKVIQVLMNRAERSTNVLGSDFGLFQTSVMLDEQVRSRTAELEAALRENEKINRALRQSEAKFYGVVNQSLVGISIIENGKYTYSNPKFNEIYGYRTDEVQALGPLDITTECDRPLVAENIRKQMSGEIGPTHTVIQGMRKDGNVIDVEVFRNVLDVDGKHVFINMVMDVTERTRVEREVKVLQERLREESIRDALTGLYNRRYLEETLGRELIIAEREGHPVSVIMADLDRFKSVNDRFGHLAGDEVLRVFGTLMKRHARASDIYCRYGGEEFLMVLPRMAEKIAVERAEQLRKEISASLIHFDEISITVTASFGVASFPRNGRTGDELVATADRALYAAKAGGRDRVNRPVLEG
jgi:diguanylate cyclase (GGDEF)-like protein/PAS domain S-box-containing protein